ncbi:MAG: DUF3604 domain-containing protein [Planctomycetota bacterium]|nr:DUF3604 domain-containing protein [Planctomycetota bacterium]
MQKLDLGKATISPRGPVVAGSNVTLTFTYTAGHPIDDNGYLKIVFRQMCDFGQPQFDDPKAPNFCSIHTTGNCRIFPRWDRKGHTRPYSRALYFQVRFGYLNKSEKIIVVFGDKSGGSPGWQMQTFRERAMGFKTFVDPIATYEFKELPNWPAIRVVAGKPVRAVCIAPSQVQAGRKFNYHLKLEDAWGNPTARPKRIVHPGFEKPGNQTVKATDKKTRLSAVSNPIEVFAEASPLGRYWADFHAQSGETIGTNPISDYFIFGRDYALLDILGHQGNDFQITDDFWAEINRTTRKFYKPGRFVTFPGFEWSGNTPFGGDRNVFYKSEGGWITRSCRDLIGGDKKSKYPDSPTATEMFANLKGPGPFVFAHVGGRYANLQMHDVETEVAMEIHSAWGTFEWLVDEALSLGYRIGICANSDGHKCRPGASYPGSGSFGSLGGLTCVLSKRLDRNSVYAAMKARHFYATTGNRPLLDVTVTNAYGQEAIMGDVIKAGDGKCVLRVRVAGTAPIESVEVRNGSDVLRTMRPFAKEDLGRRIKVIWSGAEVKGRYRNATWDGSLTVKGNRILQFTPINFWNPLRRVRRTGPASLAWESVTTGGLAGVILSLEKPSAGTLIIETVQRKASCPIRTISLTAKTWRAGGLNKQIQTYRLPHPSGPREFEFEMPLRRLKKADNPIYVCVRQEDGHMAWSSPIYLIPPNRMNRRGRIERGE